MCVVAADGDRHPPFAPVAAEACVIEVAVGRDDDVRGAGQPRLKELAGASVVRAGIDQDASVSAIHDVDVVVGHGDAFDGAHVGASVSTGSVRVVGSHAARITGSIRGWRRAE